MKDKTAKTIISIRKGAYTLRKSFDGQQREVSLGTDYRNALTKAKRFMATAELSGFEVAMAELRKRPYVKAGTDPTFDQISILYRDFCKQSARCPREQTIADNLSSLKRIMTRGGYRTIGVPVEEIRASQTLAMNIIDNADAKISHSTLAYDKVMGKKPDRNQLIILSTNQVVQAWGIDRSRIYYIFKYGELRPLTRMGRSWKFPESDFDKVEIVCLRIVLIDSATHQNNKILLVLIYLIKKFTACIIILSSKYIMYKSALYLLLEFFQLY